MKNLRETLLTLALIVCWSVAATAQNVTARIAGLETNDEYMSLLRDNDCLQQREDSVVNLIYSARERFVDHPDARDEFADYIVDLESKIFEIRKAKGLIADRINTIEQEWVLSRLSRDIQPAEEPEQPGQQPVQSVVARRNIVDNDCLRDELSADDYADLLQAHADEQTIAGDADTLLALYRRLQASAEAYAEASDELMADSIYADCMLLRDRVDSLSELVAGKWSHIVDAKSFAYGFVLEKSGRTDILNDIEARFSEMRQQYGAAEGRYMSDGLAHYAIGKPFMADYELRFAEAMSLASAADSLAAAGKSMPQREYRLDKIDLKRRLFLDYQPVAFGRTTYYNSRNPLPVLKIYDEGTIYRILLGSFKARQPMSIFKGVYPLYISQNEERMYCYYAGGYATRAEADEAQQLLRDRGFRAPQICRWVDGEMVNLTQEEDEEGRATEVTGTRYVVEIVSQSRQLSEAVHEVIAINGDKREISLAGDNTFVVGTYPDRAVADKLAAMVAEADPTLAVEVSEVTLE